jgi:hypothetical protein
MANNLLVNPVVFTTVMATSYKNQTATSLGAFQYLLIEKVIWETPVTVGDQFIFIDPISSQTLLLGTCEVAGQSQVFDWTPKPRRWQDFELSKISSGTIYLYLA